MRKFIGKYIPAPATVGKVYKLVRKFRAAVLIKELEALKLKAGSNNEERGDTILVRILGFATIGFAGTSYTLGLKFGEQLIHAMEGVAVTRNAIAREIIGRGERQWARKFLEGLPKSRLWPILLSKCEGCVSDNRSQRRLHRSHQGSGRHSSFHPRDSNARYSLIA